MKDWKSSLVLAALCTCRKISIGEDFCARFSRTVRPAMNILMSDYENTTHF